MKQISLIQVQSSPPPVAPTVAPTLIASTVVQPEPTQIDEEMVYIKSEPTPQPPQQIIPSIPSTSTASLILPAPSEPPQELIESFNVKEEEEIQIDDTNPGLNLLSTTDQSLLSTLNVPPSQPPVEGTSDSVDSTEIKMNEISSG